ncbi:MAG TPA: FTR1 family protein [Nitrososphaera sp.]|nr:FTR1 family protein [Nitrososphaera sp.]
MAEHSPANKKHGHGDINILNKKNILHRSATKPRINLVFYLVTLLAIIQPFVPSYFSAYGQVLSDTDALIVMVNIERIRTQLWLTEQSLDNNNLEMAFAHAFIPHTTTFPTIKGQLERSVGEHSTQQLESLLTDLPFKMRTGEYSQEETRESIGQIRLLLDQISQQAIGGQFLSDKGMLSQVVVFLLRDAVQSYATGTNSNTSSGTEINGLPQTVDYENAVGLVHIAHQNFQGSLSSLIDDTRRKSEIESFFNQLETSLAQRLDNQSILRLTTAIERDLAEELSVSEGSESTSEHQQYFATIRTLLSQVISEVNNGNYEQADQYAISAYLDNYEYLEAPIEKHDPDLMLTIEEEMREELRSMIKARESGESIESFVNGILTKLDSAEQLLKNDLSFSQGSATLGSSTPFADIQGLQAGFGTYTGERKDMGEAEDPAKAAVRSDIDAIRMQLDETLRLHKEGNYDGALLTSRSAYLDSYESVEIPLRPIDPDFTLEMEIKFAELRNLIQAHAPYNEVEAKVIEIRKGLDESERLVSGTGILAPSIAFSTSFSIIFREGLESALIIGAILTYLEASRNNKFKKHVYYGIVIAIGATAVTWFIAEFIIEISGASRELIEAIAGISAVAVLFWVSFWVLNKIETKRWIEFVKAKVWKATATGSIMVFVMLSFFTVYREGFETVLFYQAMLSFAKYMEWYVVAGLIAGLAVIVATAIVVRKLGKRLPLKVLFALTMGIGAYMSIAFIGNAIREFQEVGYISTTHLIGTVPRLDINLATMTGIHPTLETIVAQIALLAVYVAGSLYILIILPRRQKIIESARKSRQDLVKEDKRTEEGKSL